jgi:hypothetical protein
VTDACFILCGSATPVGDCYKADLQKEFMRRTRPTLLRCAAHAGCAFLKNKNSVWRFEKENLQ